MDQLFTWRLFTEEKSFGVRLAILRFIVELAGVSGLHSCVASEGLWAKSLSLTLESTGNRAFQSARKNEDRIKLVPGNGNEVQLNREP
jgi:hypothetical protein